MPETLSYGYEQPYSLEQHKPEAPATAPLKIPFSSELSHLHNEAKLGYMVTDLSGEIQRFRGKENKIYTTVSGQEFFAKYIQQQEKSHFDDIEGMAKEKILLDYLQDTGVVPRTGAFRLYPNQQRARLLLEKLPGQSLDRLGQEWRLESQAVSQIITSTAASLDKIHQAQVMVGDINAGTFLLNSDQQGLKVKILDLEIGCHLQDEPEQLESLAHWQAKTDPGARALLANQTPAEINPQLLAQLELHRWGKTLAEWIMGSEYLDSSAELPTDQQAYINQTESYLGPLLKNEVEQKLRRMYNTYYRKQYEAGWIDETEDQFVQSEADGDYRAALKDAVIGAYFSAYTKDHLPQLPTQLVDFIKQTLAANPTQRPDSFQQILSPSSQLAAL